MEISSFVLLNVSKTKPILAIICIVSIIRDSRFEGLNIHCPKQRAGSDCPRRILPLHVEATTF